MIWPQKHEKRFLRKFEVRERTFCVYRRPQGIYADLTLKLQREQTTGTPPFCFPSVIAPRAQQGEGEGTGTQTTSGDEEGNQRGDGTASEGHD